MEGVLRRLGVTAAGRALDLLFPRFCARCGAEGSVWCGPCAASFVPFSPSARCPFCARAGSYRTCADCRNEGASLDGLVAVASYANPVARRALTDWKYHGDPENGRAVDLWIRQAAAARDGFGFSPGSTVTYAPLHVSRRRHRGFDQAEEVARSLAGATGLPFRALLSRDVATGRQAMRAAEDRAVGDLDGAFAAVGNLPRKVVLCDDVFTSGATLDAAAMALKRAGAETVWGFAVARASRA